MSKTGFVTLSYGQRRPLQSGTPLQLADGQQFRGVDFRLPRGSVISGHVYDETGDPMPGATVRVLQYRYAQGQRQLVPADTAQTDDCGTFRMWGLNPGDYYVAAVARNFNFGPRGGFRGGQVGAFSGRGAGTRGGRGAPPGGFLDVGDDDETAKVYAPTYYPGVPSVEESRPVTVGVGQELLDVDFNLLLVRTAHVAGTVMGPDGSITYSGQVNLTPDTGSGAGGRGQIGVNFGSRIDWEGRFSIANVPPGRYTLRARGTDTDPPQFAAQPLTVASGEVADVPLILSPGATLSGSVAFEGADAPEFSQVRVTAPATESGAALGPNPNARVDKDGRFTLDGVAAGLHFIRLAGQLRGWSLKSVMVDGRDVVDTPIALRSGQQLNNVVVTFSSRQTEINGTIIDLRGDPVTDFTVLAFPFDTTLWRPLSRQIATARPDQTGRFQLRGLPAGSYYLATVDPAEQGEWFEPAFLDQQRIGAASVVLSEGGTQTHDFRLAVR